LRREIAYELLQDQDGSWAWRHHPGSLPAAPLGGDADAGPSSAADLARLRERAPGVQVITIPGGGADVVGTQPAALAAAVNQLLTTAPEGQR
jgi:pimeloyl-ACP methyl ester carboxylesterase